MDYPKLKMEVLRQFARAACVAVSRMTPVTSQDFSRALATLLRWRSIKHFPGDEKMLPDPT